MQFLEAATDAARLLIGFRTNSGNNTIGEANLDGTDPNQSFIKGADDPIALTVDGSHIYWANRSGNTIGEANLDGSGVNQSFITGANAPQGVVVDGQHIYWANGGNNTIGEANLDGTDPSQSFITGANFPDGVGVTVPIVGVSPASPPAFPGTVVGKLSEPQTVTITNSGQRNLLIDNLSLTGTDPTDFKITSNSCEGSLAAGDSCQLQVSFAPHGKGPRSATLQITTSDYANSPLAIQLSGTGQQASSSSSLTLSKATVTFGSEQLERFNATVSSQTTGTPTGKVTIRSGAITLCTITLASGHGSCSPKAKALPAGKHTITATYTGNGTFKPSTSPGEALTVKT